MDGEEQFTLLLVDDNPTNLMLLAKIVEYDLPEVQVLTASSGREGLELAASRSIDGAFIDVQMPQMNGLEMCHRLKADPRTADMPLVLITAHNASAEMRAEGLEAGAYDFISQPVSNVEMLARIKVMLRLCQTEQRVRQDRRQLQRQVDDHSAQLRWVSGLLLSGDGPLAEPDQQLLERLARRLPQPQQLDQQQLAEKLTSEFPLPWRRTLCKLALLDDIPLPLARRLSEITDIEAMLDYLQRHDLSLQPDLSGDGRLHFSPAIKKLLRHRAEQILNETDRQRVFLEAAAGYQQQEEFAAAINCLLRAGQYSALSQMLRHYGLILLRDSQQERVLQLLAEVPEETAAGCGWLSLFAGISRLLIQPEQVGSWLELARNRFVEEGDGCGELFALAQQVRQYLFIDGRFELGRERLPRLRHLVSEQLDLLAPFNRLKVGYLSGLAELFFAGDLIRVEEQLGPALAESQQLQNPELQRDFNLLRGLLSLYQGRLRVARSAIEQALRFNNQLQSRSLTGLALKVCSCELLLAGGDLDGFQRQRRQLGDYFGSEKLQRTIFAALLGFHAVLAQLSRGKRHQASETLTLTLGEGCCTQNPHLQSWLLQLRGWLRAFEQDREGALGDLQKALQHRDQAGGPLCGTINLLLAGLTCLELGQLSNAAAYLQQGLELSQELGEVHIRPGLLAWQSLLQLRLGDAGLAREKFAQLLELLQQRRLTYFLTLTPTLVRELLEQLQTDSRFRPQLEQLAGEWLSCGLLADGRLVPLLHLKNLGGFRLQLEDRELDLGSLTHSSREILAQLAAAPRQTLGTDLLMTNLWPESSESKARSSFDTAHSRLRKALQASFGERIKQDYLVLDKGMLSLRHTRIDSRSYQELVEEARHQLQRQNDWQATQLLWHADGLWQGEYLAGFMLDGELPYLREQVNQLRQEQLGMMAELLARSEQVPAAIRLLRQGLQVDPLQENLVCQLLRLLQQSGERQQSRQLIAQYRQALQAADYDSEEIAELIDAMNSSAPELLDTSD